MESINLTLIRVILKQKSYIIILHIKSRLVEGMFEVDPPSYVYDSQSSISFYRFL